MFDYQTNCIRYILLPLRLFKSKTQKLLIANWQHYPDKLETFRENYRSILLLGCVPVVKPIRSNSKFHTARKLLNLKKRRKNCVTLTG